MPPKPKFTREEIVNQALKLVSLKGAEGLTARELGDMLGSSARPIFTVFKNMEELQEAVTEAAMKYFEAYGKEWADEMPVFKQVGMKMVLFGLEEPKLYQLLFMKENKNYVSFDELSVNLGMMVDVCIEAIQTDYRLSAEEAKFLFENVWIYTFGVGALCATKVCSFSKEEISELLSTQFQAVLGLVISRR